MPPTRRRRTRTAVVAALALLTTACSGSGSGTTGDASTTSSSIAVPDALDLTATLVGGDPFDGAELAGGPVVFWFWSPRCSACDEEVATIAAASDQWSTQLTFVGVTRARPDDARVEEFIVDHDLSFTQIADQHGEVFDHFGVPEPPALVLVARDGTVERVLGAVEQTALDNLLAALAG